VPECRVSPTPVCAPVNVWMKLLLPVPVTPITAIMTGFEDMFIMPIYLSQVVRAEAKTGIVRLENCAAVEKCQGLEGRFECIEAL